MKLKAAGQIIETKAIPLKLQTEQVILPHIQSQEESKKFKSNELSNCFRYIFEVKAMEDMDIAWTILSTNDILRFVGFQLRRTSPALWPVVDRQSVIRPIFPDWPRGE